MSNLATNFAGARSENFSSIWLNTDHFAETVTQYPLGVRTAAVSVTAIVHKAEEGETPVDDRDGSQVIRYLLLTLPTTVTVTVAERAQQRDEFLIDGEIWRAEKIVRRTPYRQQVRCRRTEGASTKRTRTR
ncbi:MAG TPA: hypothetical protein VJ783_27070 [Pirellulales bacterium]|nr:hypothetical protein [Pirellulales bacterium]